ncbi:MAG: ABC transporter ATP-binding protein [Ruminococcaceae bacterium]|nr:ABC transporter ATP-binding protein [Oscillospiraceae bacterium]
MEIFMVFGKHINRYYLKYSPVLTLGILALVLVDVLQLEVPRLYKMVINGINDGVVEIDGVLHEFNTDFLLDKVCLPMIFIILFMVIGRFLWRICFFGSGIKVETDIRRRMFDHCRDLSQQYYQVNKVGNMMSLFTNDLETVQDCFGSGILMFFDALLLGGLAIYKMWMMNWFLALLTLIPMVLLLLVGTIVGKYMREKWEIRQAAFSDLSDFSQENFSGIAVVKAFVKEFLELLAFKKLNVKNENANVAYTKASTLLNISVTLFVESVICIILGYGGYLVYNDTFNAGELIEFISYFTSIVWPVMAVSQLIEMQSRGQASLSRISELLDAPLDVKDNDGVIDPGEIKGDIEFKNLTFRYPDGSYDVLNNVSFKISAGENVGIIGKTGSGKTTIVDLILRTYNVPDGTIFIDGHDVNTIPIKSVRKYAAYVPQDNFLFSDTIENNIAFASDEVSIEDVVAAAKNSDVDTNISEFTEGYKTVLGERGVTVSGGQKQRISIARALMKNAPILILDDSVSAVDTKTEKTILDNLRENRQGKTTILIAHRITTIEKMDKIIFINDGSISAIGTHTELLNTCAEYKTMVDLQKLDEEHGGEINA